MKFPLLKIAPLLFGLFIIGVSFGSFAKPVEAATCTGGYVSTCTGGYAYQSNGPYGMCDFYTALPSSPYYWSGGYCIPAGTYAGAGVYLCYSYPGDTTSCAGEFTNTCQGWTNTCQGWTYAPTSAPTLTLTTTPAGGTVTTEQTFQFTWTAVDNSPTDYQKSVSISGGAWSAWGSIGLITAWPSSPSTPASQQGLPAGNTYAFRIRGCNSDGCGPPSNTATLTVNAVVASTCASGTDAVGNPLTLLNVDLSTAESGGKYRVTKFGGNYCYGNSGSTRYFVPLKSWAEFNSFLGAIPLLSGSGLYTIP